jgi:hypothetical protein
MKTDLDKKLSEHFTYRELMDAETKEMRLQPGFLEDLETLRKALGAPMTITSACRSPKTMERLRKEGYRVAKASFHLMENKVHKTFTCAVDVATRDPVYNGRLIMLALSQGWRVFSYKSHIHLDLGNKYADTIPNEPIFVRID